MKRIINSGIRTGAIYEGELMMDPKTNKKEEQWADEIPDPETEMPEEYEETYRDGSAKNECWSEN